TAQSATVTVSASSIPGTVSTILVGGAANQTNAGTYATTATFVPTDSANYNSLTTVAAGNFVIGKATPTATLAVSNSPVTYNATAQSATVTVSASSVPGTVSTILVGTAANQTNAGTYATTATFVPTDSANYNSLTTVAAGNFVISKATPTATLTVSNSPVTYNASARTATVTVSASSVPGTVSTILLGTAANQTNAGTYATTATFLPTDSANYNSLTTVAAGNFVISKATPTISVNNSPVIYNGIAQTATVAGSVPGTVSSILVDGAANQTNAGSYATTGSFVPTDTSNYNSLTSVSAGNFVISKANQTITWATPASILQGTALQATQLNATVDGVSGGSAAGALTYTPAAGTVLAVGTHTLSVSAAATSNYLAASRTVQIVVNSTTVAPSVTWQLLPGQVNSFGNTNLRNLTYVATYSAGRSTPQKTDFNVMGGTISSIIPIAGTNRTVFNVIISVVLQGNVPAQMTSFVRAGWNAIGSTVPGTASAPVTINSLKRNIPSPLLASPTKPAGSLLGNSDAAIFNMVATFASPVDPATVTPNAFGTTNGTESLSNHFLDV
ncbi:MAG: MBG domain-containing protein, partial [Planctomycetota bacterium]|nr:MBG domain-containing protein [Planctomycetota bacterium]